MTVRDESLKQDPDSAGHTRSLLRDGRASLQSLSSEGVGGGDREHQRVRATLKGVLEVLNANKGPQEGPCFVLGPGHLHLAFYIINNLLLLLGTAVGTRDFAHARRALCK